MALEPSAQGALLLLHTSLEVVRQDTQGQEGPARVHAQAQITLQG